MRRQDFSHGDSWLFKECIMSKMSFIADPDVSLDPFRTVQLRITKRWFFHQPSESVNGWITLQEKNLSSVSCLVRSRTSIHFPMPLSPSVDTVQVQPEDSFAITMWTMIPWSCMKERTGSLPELPSSTSPSDKNHRPLLLLTTFLLVKWQCTQPCYTDPIRLGTSTSKGQGMVQSSIEQSQDDRILYYRFVLCFLELTRLSQLVT